MIREWASLACRTSTIALTGGCVLAASIASAQTVQGAGDADTPDQIIVTGTRAEGRTAASSAAPIDILDAKTLTGTAQINVFQALNKTLPSFNLPGTVSPDLGGLVRAGQLRNLDPAYTLVLVNGKRRHTTAVVNEIGFPGSVAVDLALIPTQAIGRIEVLRDGASAIYGSDAIAGVINVILRTDQGFSASSQIGQSYAGDGESGYLRAGYGMKLGDRGYIRIDGEYDAQNIAVRNFALQPTYLSYPAISKTTGLPVRLGANNSLPAGAVPDPREATRNANPWRNVGVPRTRTAIGSFNANYDLADALTLYGFGTYSHRTGSAAQNYRLPATIFASNPGLLSVYPDGFTPFETIRENDFSLTGGLKGKLIGWDWDLSSTYGKDDIDVGVQNSANFSLTYPGGPTSFYIGNRNYSRLTSNLDLHRSLSGLFEDPLDVSFGAEYSHEHQAFNPGAPNSYYGGGSVALIGYLPTDRSSTGRESYAGYIGLSAQPVHKLLLDLAGRVEHYSDFGTNVSGRLSARYDFSPVFAIRGTISNGFHAPALITESYSSTSDKLGTPYLLARPDSPTARALGATPLKAEKARNYTVGFTLTPGANIRLAVDAYQIDVDNRLGVSSNIGVDYSSGSPVDGSGRALTAAQAQIIRNLLTGAGVTIGQGVIAHYFTNVGDTRSRGIDATIEGSNPFVGGRLRWNAALNINGTRFRRINPIPAALKDLPNITGLSLAAQYNIRYLSPKDKEIVGLRYEIGRWALDVRETRFGKLQRLNPNTNTGYDLHAQYTTDASVTLKVAPALDITVGGTNIFDVMPQQTPVAARTAASLAQYVGVYDNSGPLGALGGYYYGRIGVRF